MKLKQTITFCCQPDAFSRIRHEVEEFLQTAGLDDRERALLVLAIDEACTNVFRHAYGQREGRRARILLEAGKKTIRICLRDYGKPCDPAAIRGRALKDYRPGGLGVHLIRQVFDEAEWIPEARGNRLRLVYHRK